MKTKTETIAFRADTDLLRYIDERRSRFGLSRGNWVRGMIAAELVREDGDQSNGQFEAVEQSLEEVQQMLSRLTSNVARSLFYVLTRIGDMPVEEAKDLVRSKLNVGNQE